VSSVPAAASARPANFANASPFQTKQKGRDPVGVALIVASLVALAAAGGAVFHDPANAAGPLGHASFFGRTCFLPPVLGGHSAVCWRNGMPRHGVICRHSPFAIPATGDQPRQRTQFRLGWTPDELRVLFRSDDDHAWDDADRTRRAPLPGRSSRSLSRSGRRPGSLFRDRGESLEYRHGIWSCAEIAAATRRTLHGSARVCAQPCKRSRNPGPPSWPSPSAA